MAPIEYGKRDFDTVATYTDKGFLDVIHKATGLSERGTTAVVIDLMAGPGKVAFGMQERAPQHSYAVLDYDQAQLDRVTQPVRKILADVRNLSAVVEDGSIGVATVRYGLKDIPKDQQPGVLLGINKALEKGGVLVIADMVSPEGAKDFTNKQHSLKQQFGGRDIEKEGECNIPTEQGWLDMLTNAGFEPEITGHYISRVSTSDWLRGNQLGDPKSPEAGARKAKMDEVILGTSDEIKKQFNIREENGEVKIEYPVVIIRAVKSEARVGVPTSGTVYEAK
ncbi:MAG: class I SAM-dependent methyltransferase [Candidatus Levybacteria bacterium]|nr:class I SAM-dependent methyltransferase [Candidatus Levybacteria bacterium]MDZ4228614.1 class I SAM-dependent methyltransferase [Candidatus Levybacteria bacterium]